MNDSTFVGTDILACQLIDVVTGSVSLLSNLLEYFQR